jgi:hypothetical protein
VVTKQSDCTPGAVEAESEAVALGQEAHKRIRAREYDAARPIIERALALDPENAMLAHLKAHLCIDSGAFEEGAAYLRPFLETHDPFEGVNVHTAWHLAYIELELGRPAAALSWHRRVVAPTVGRQTFYSAVTLLWQLEVFGYGRDALRPDWEEMRTAALDITHTGTTDLDELARAMTFIATGDEQNLAVVRERVGTAQDDSAAREVVRPLVEGLRAYWHGDFAGAIDLIAPIVPSLGRLSEFTDQLSIFHDTLKDARTRAPASAGAAGART